MSLAMKISLVLSVVVLTLGTVVCGFSPTAPFVGFDGQASQGTVGTEGATLNGTFAGSGGSGRALRALAATAADNLIVIVFDLVKSGDPKEIGRVKVVDGRFTLRGLPESFKLEFRDGGKTVGEETFDGVKPNQEIDIVLEYEGGAVTVLEESRTGINHEPGDGIEIDGTAVNIFWEDPDDPMTGSLDVNEWQVITQRTQTSIRKGNRSLTLEDLNPGDQVHVRGVVGDDGTYVFAHEIKLQEEEEEDDTDKTSGCPADPAKPGHILICHNGKVQSVAEDAWAGHQSHGDTCASENATPGEPCGS